MTIDLTGLPPLPTDAEREAATAAHTRITNWIKADAHITDGKENRGYILHTDETVEAVQSFLRNHLDGQRAWIPGDTNELHEYLDSTYRRDFHDTPIAQGPDGFTDELALRIFDDLTAIWAYPYYRDEISHWAIDMSLCPMHFCDWCSCFDDDDEECAQIRAIFPHSHDT